MQLWLRDFSAELNFKTARSSGPGGQHVNKTETKVTLVFDVAASLLFSDEEKARLRSQLRTRINKLGHLSISSSAGRSQFLNKKKTVEKFYALLEKVFAPQKVRKRARPSQAKVEERLQNKKKLSEKKESRKKIDD